MLGDGRSVIHNVTQSIVDNVRVLWRLKHGGPLEGEEELEDEVAQGEGADSEESLRRAFEEQEITLRQALHVIS